MHLVTFNLPAGNNGDLLRIKWIQIGGLGFKNINNLLLKEKGGILKILEKQASCKDGIISVVPIRIKTVMK